MSAEVETLSKHGAKLILDVSEAFVSKTEDGKRRIIEAEERFKEAAAFLDGATTQIKASWIEWLRESKSYTEEIRTWRMAMERENKVGLAACKDTLDYLSTPEIVEKLKVLRELIEVSERLKALKESGYLDSVVDTLLKVRA